MRLFANRLSCAIFGHNAGPWFSTTYNVNHAFADGRMCYDCGALLFVYGPERAPYGGVCYTVPVDIRGYIRAPGVHPRNGDQTK